MNPLVRPATEGDLGACADLLHTLFSQDNEFEPDRSLQLRGLALILTNPAVGTLLVAEHEGRVVGMVSLLSSVSTALGGPVGTLEDLIVAEGCRGRGVGSSLLRTAQALAWDKGLLRVTLLTDHDNHPALAFYAHFGFVRSTMVPLRKVLVGLPRGSALPWSHDPMEPR